MPKVAEDLEKVTIRLFAGDFARLGELYPGLSANQVIRVLIHKHIRKIEDRDARLRKEVAGDEVPLDL